MYFNLQLFALLLLALVNQMTSYPSINKGGYQQESANNLNAPEKPRQRGSELVTTIEQVQQILEQDPNLPRLTRGEIEELYEQVTREEYEKSLHVGDIGRANSMRALMLVLPYNTDNTTDENLQELYTRPPVTKVIDEYSLPQPQKYQTPSSATLNKVEIVEVGNVAATTYKPSFRLKAPTPTTYHPNQPIYKATATSEATEIYFQPVTNAPQVSEFGMRKTPGQRFSSHYSAKNVDFLSRRPSKKQATDISDYLHSVGLTATPAQTPSSTKRLTIDNYYVAESAPKPVISSIIRQSTEAPNFEVLNRNLAPKINRDAYLSFRPLNIGEEVRYRPEVEDYLTRFGIVGGRKRKSLKKEDDKSVTTTTKATTTTTTTTTIAPRLNNQQVSLRAALNASDKANDDVSDLRKPQGFRRRIDTNIDIDSGADNTYKSDQSDRLQLQKLLENLQELERLNISLTADLLKRVDPKSFNLSQSLLDAADVRQGPDPFTADGVDQQKNEIKRQSDSGNTTTVASTTADNSDDTDSIPPEPTRFNFDLSLDPVQSSDLRSSTGDSSLSASSTSSTATTSTATEEESRNGSIADLEDSFGPDPNTESPLPPKKVNGFYFLADWNSFLEVGEGDEQVVVRFDPKIGDPRRFIPVKIP